jgi:hypothetical protein
MSKQSLGGKDYMIPAGCLLESSSDRAVGKFLTCEGSSLNKEGKGNFVFAPKKVLMSSSNSLLNPLTLSFKEYPREHSSTFFFYFAFN